MFPSFQAITHSFLLCKLLLQWYATFYSDSSMFWNIHVLCNQIILFKGQTKVPWLATYSSHHSVHGTKVMNRIILLQKVHDLSYFFIQLTSDQEKKTNKLDVGYCFRHNTFKQLKACSVCLFGVTKATNQQKRKVQF